MAYGYGKESYGKSPYGSPLKSRLEFAFSKSRIKPKIQFIFQGSDKTSYLEDITSITRSGDQVVAGVMTARVDNTDLSWNILKDNKSVYLKRETSKQVIVRLGYGFTEGVRFLGTDGQLRIPYNSDYDTLDFTLEFFLKVSVWDGGIIRGIVYQEDSGGGSLWSLDYYFGVSPQLIWEVPYYYWIDGIQYFSSLSLSFDCPPANNWHLIQLQVYKAAGAPPDGQKIAADAYVDGVSQGSAEDNIGTHLTKTRKTSALPIFFGKNTLGFHSQFSIDGIKMSSVRKFSGKHAYELKEPIDDLDTIGLWNLNDSGLTAVDDSAAANDGTLSGSFLNIHNDELEGNELLYPITLFTGFLENVRYDDKLVSLGLRDRLSYPLLEKAGSDAEPIGTAELFSPLPISYNPADIVWQLLSKYGASSLTDFSNPDIDYSAWKQWQTNLKSLAYQLEVYLKGETVGNVLQKIAEMTHSAIYADGEGKIICNLWLNESQFTPIRNYDLSNFFDEPELEFSKDDAKTKIVTGYGYNPALSIWQGTASRGGISPSYGEQTESYLDTLVWHKTLASADGFSQRKLDQIQEPQENIKLNSEFALYFLKIGDGIRVSDSGYSWVNQGMKIDSFNFAPVQGTVEIDSHLVSLFNWFILDDRVYGILDQNYLA